MRVSIKHLLLVGAKVNSVQISNMMPLYVKRHKGALKQKEEEEKNTLSWGNEEENICRMRKKRDEEI